MPLVRTPMIAPTKIYENVPTLSPEEAAGLIVDAIVHKPVRIATRLGIFGALCHAVAPRLTQVLLNTAYNMFPDSTAAQGRKSAEPQPLTAEQLAFLPPTVVHESAQILGQGIDHGHHRRIHVLVVRRPVGAEPLSIVVPLEGSQERNGLGREMRASHGAPVVTDEPACIIIAPTRGRTDRLRRSCRGSPGDYATTHVRRR